MCFSSDGWHSLKQPSLLGRARDTLDGTGPTCNTDKRKFCFLKQNLIHLRYIDI